jgi:hypothetical protein
MENWCKIGQKPQKNTFFYKKLKRADLWIGPWNGAMFIKILSPFQGNRRSLYSP